MRPPCPIWPPSPDFKWSQSDRDVEIALDYLRRAGIAWSAQPTSEEVGREYERMWRQTR